MFNFDNHYGKTDTKKEKQEIKDLEESFKVLGANARACLHSHLFHTYRKQYEVTEEKMVESMLRLTTRLECGEFDLNAYGTKVLILMTRLKDLRSLLMIIKNDSKKGQDNEEKTQT